MLPKKTKFKGVNFVVESHMLERPKVEYQFNEIYLGEGERHNINNSLVLQEIDSTVRRY